MAKKPKTADDEAEVAEGSEVAAGKFAFLKNKLVLGGIVAILALGGGGGWFFLFKGKGGSDVAALRTAARLDGGGDPGEPGPVVRGGPRRQPGVCCIYADLPHVCGCFVIFSEKSSVRRFYAQRSDAAMRILGGGFAT